MHISAVKIAAIGPSTKPVNRNANGMVSIPDPIEPFKKWINVSVSLEHWAGKSRVYGYLIICSEICGTYVVA